ncbi:hypothetical protein, partial [Microvirga sp. Mcv34]|uniref:hypothetical protein n=1 Tax=Microvirga sp. Mcv34 TaxID=2926016 RepID=UPI0021C60A9C
MMRARRRRVGLILTVAVVSVALAALLLIRYQSRALASIATSRLSFPLLQWSASILEQEVIQYRGSIYRIAASSAHNFQMLDDDTLRFEVRQGDRYRSASWTDAEGIERSEMGETTTHALSGNGSHFHATYKMMIEPGAKN